MGRFNGDSKGRSKTGFWIMVLVVWLVMGLAVLPVVMGCSDSSCTTQDPNNLLVLWLDILTFFGAVPYLGTIFGVWGGLFVFAFLDCMD